MGKTSIARAPPSSYAARGRRVLLVSTDRPNAGRCLAGDRHVADPAVPHPLGPSRSTRRRPPRPTATASSAGARALPDSVLKEILGACTTEIAAFDEFTGCCGFQPDPRLPAHRSGNQAHRPHHPPAAAARRGAAFWRREGRDASCLGPLAGWKQRSQYSSGGCSADGARTRLVLVARAQQATLREVAHHAEARRHRVLTGKFLVINGLGAGG